MKKKMFLMLVMTCLLLNSGERLGAAENLEEMTRYDELEFQQGEEMWTAELYTGAEVDENGEPMLDDQNDFLIRVVSEQKEYVLFEEKVQLGTPEIDVFTDVDGILHVIVRNVSTAGYQMTDYVFEKEKDQFVAAKEIAYDGINYIGRSGI